MAGSYPDAPSRRMAYDADGTIVGYQDEGVGPIIELAPWVVTEINDEDDGAPIVNSDDSIYSHIFPELREVDGFFGRFHVANRITQVETSGDTTNGIDGTWTVRIADYDDSSGVSVYGTYRDEITSLAVSNVRALRWRHFGTVNLRAIHLYGEISTGETPDRLLWVDNATGSEFSLPIDYGDIPRGSAEDLEVKLRNNSGSLSAGSVQVTAEAPYLGSGSWYTFKEAGGSFQSTLSLSQSIGAGSDSPVLTIRRITPDGETLGLHAARAYANVGSWS